MNSTNDDVLELLANAKKQGVNVFLNENGLKVKIDKSKPVDQALINTLKANKSLIVDFLQSESKNFQEISKGVQRIPRYNRDEIERIPLSFAQEQLWFIDQLQGSLNFHSSNIFKIKGDLNRALLEKTIQTIIDRHEVLRTVLRQDENANTYQHILESELWKMKLTEVTREDNLNEIFKNDLSVPFILKEDFLIRVHLLKLEEEEYMLHIVMHHLVYDGWSMPIFFSELVDIYNALSQGLNHNLEELPIQYADYAIWQHKHFDKHSLEDKIAYWEKKLDNYEIIELATDYPRPPVHTTKGKSITRTLNKNVTKKIKDVASTEGVSLFVLMLTTYKSLIYRYTGQKDLCIGTASANRDLPGVDKLIGFFINMLPLRTKLKDEQTVKMLIHDINETVLSGFQYKDVPFEKIIDKVEKHRDRSRSPIFQILLVYQGKTTVTNKKMKLGDLEISFDNINNENAKYDLVLYVSETDTDELALELVYSMDLFKEETMGLMLDHYEQLVVSMIENLDQKIDDVQLLSLKEKSKITNDFNNTNLTFPEDESIISLFEKQVEETPNNIALEFEGEVMTFKELNEESNKVAHYLKKNHKIDAGDCVGIMLNRSFNMIISILGILKAGGAYVPIEIDLPEERKQFIVEDTSIDLIIIESSNLVTLFNIADLNAFVIDIELEKLKEHENLGLTINSNDLAYIMYTSGSTGKPKGSLVSHKNVVKLFYGQEEMAIHSSDKVLQWSNFSFDGSVYEIFGALLKGASLHLIPENAASDIGKLGSKIKQDNISFSFITTALFNAFVDFGAENLKGMRKILFGGELASVPHAKKALDILGPNKLIHVYGTTEATVFSTYYPINHIEESLPIGKPLSNTSIYIFDKNQHLSGIGMVGEIYIGGQGVSKGYLNREALNKSKFITDVNVSNNSEKLYKSGDLAKWGENGNIEIIGRLDNLIKIRGYRIELGEVESVLQKEPSIKQCCVVYNENSFGDKYIIAYVVPKDKLEINELKLNLSKKLPQYMIPTFFVEITSFPLNENGKIDKKKLPIPEASDYITNKYTGPTNDVEQKIVKIWQELIDIKRVGIYDDFFEIGGHSLIATKLVGKIKKEFNFILTVGDVFNYPTVKELSEIILQQNRSEDLNEKINLEEESNFEINYQAMKQLKKYDNPPKNILLTGATGFVGSYVLNDLMKSTDSKIFCLVRKTDKKTGLQRIKEKMEFFQLDTSNLKERIEIVYGDIAKNNLGIDHSTYHSLLSTIDSVFHIGTNMDHHSSYYKLRKANVLGNVELINFSIKEKLKKIIYISTQPQTGVTSNEPIYETNDRGDEVHTYSKGYSGSKWVGEKIILDGISQGLDAVIFRLGLITGDSVTGKIPEEQWFPKLLKTCYDMGVYFSEFYIPVIPVDFVSKAIVDTGLFNSDQKVFHLTAPKLVSLQRFFENQNEANKKVRKVSIKEWLVKLDKNKSNDLPILSFIDFNSEQIKNVMNNDNSDNNNVNISLFVDNPVSTESTLKCLKECFEMEYPTTSEYFDGYLEAVIKQINKN